MPHVQGILYITITPLHLSIMSAPPIKRRRTRAIGPDSIQFSTAFTHKTVTTTNRSGSSVTKDVLVPLVPTKPPEDDESTFSTTHIPSKRNDYDPPMEEPASALNDFDENINCNKSKVR